MNAQLTLHCYKVLSLPLPVTEATLSRILGTIVQTYTGIEDNQNCCSTFYYAIGSIATAQADSAVPNFCENCTPSILTPYLDGIVSKLLVLLQTQFNLWWINVVDQWEHFQKNCEAVTPYLKSILVNAANKSNSMLRAKAMECIISFVGMAVGKEKFRDDAKQGTREDACVLMCIFPRAKMCVGGPLVLFLDVC
ncbi:ARM repeat superfamily protein [Actinidia rufa]|uniref:ARM repeat superfamily protein n=1 Tax=Actinidia rufa TaxID=165716 RepID=A0A7J0E781_9ERIC|nr:ARM repeat superfamily protein [Actinidia rufa]